MLPCGNTVRILTLWTLVDYYSLYWIFYDMTSKNSCSDPLQSKLPLILDRSFFNRDRMSLATYLISSKSPSLFFKRCKLYFKDFALNLSHFVSNSTSLELNWIELNWTDTSLRYRHWRMCFERLLQAFARWQPGILFDIAAQPILEYCWIDSYSQPSLRTQFKVATVYSIHTRSLSWCSTRLVPNVLPRRDEGSGEPCAVDQAS